MKYSFSGHETFACKQHWLKKGLDYIQTDNSFGDDAAVVHLGVGKNMVTSIRHWVRAFGLLDDQDRPTPIAQFLFGPNGADLYLEDTLTLWLLHYHLIKQGKSSIYNLVFNQFRRERQDFNKGHLERFLKRKIEENQEQFSNKTLESDIKVFINNYLSTDLTDIEEGYTNVLQELNLISHFSGVDDQGKLIDWYRFNVGPKADLPYEVMLYIMLNQYPGQQSLSLAALANDSSSLGNVFLLNEIALADKLKLLPSTYGVFTETAGNPVLQLQPNLDQWEILKTYYGNH
ncbi:DUF4007 family protein [Parapedobacter koreensis]|uniref:DUF4007 domain-containing protein n=1 Tax=Parapedobacter koreensis TaxID=332977 RepID=A0A1H7Q1F7_9SPHI|nr:DUF4007 family protein [Parapedobacter koreensis]SEL41315.1 Protein of unknown function [Parapedobacter koreensis]